MSRTKLGEQYVRFAVDGLKESEQAVVDTSKKIDSTWSSMRKKVVSGISSLTSHFSGMRGAVNGFAGSFNMISSGIGKMASGAKSLALMAGAGAGGFFAYFARGAMEGTREGEVFSRSIEILTRTVGAIFAPAVRLATGLIMRAATAFSGLTDDTKASIAVWTLVATGIGTAVAMLPVFGGVLSAVFTLGSGLVTAFVGTMGLIGPAVTLAGTLVTGFASLTLGAFALIPPSVTAMAALVTTAITGMSAVCSGVMGALSLAISLGPIAAIGLAVAGIAVGAAAIVGSVAGTVVLASGKLDGLITGLVGVWMNGGASITADTKTWIGSFTKFVLNGTLQAARSWNVLMGEVQKAYVVLKTAYDKMDTLISTVTGKSLPNFHLNFSGLTIDDKALAEKFTRWTSWTDELGSKIADKFGSIKNFVTDLPGAFKGLPDRLSGIQMPAWLRGITEGLPGKAVGLFGEAKGFMKDIMNMGGAMKFNIKFDAGFESLQASWDRIQSADFNINEQLLDVDKRQLDVLERMLDAGKERWNQAKGLIGGGGPAMAVVGD